MKLKGSVVTQTFKGVSRSVFVERPGKNKRVIGEVVLCGGEYQPLGNFAFATDIDHCKAGVIASTYLKHHAKH